jgi:uncharacterized membrane protein
MSTMPVWALSLIFWLHMLATVSWVGSLAAIAWLVLPAAKSSLKPAEQVVFIEAVQRRLEPVAWFSLFLLIVTGMFQLSTNPHYNGFISTSNQWSLAILVKHSLVAVMLVVSALQTWEVLPAIRRSLMRRQKGDLRDEADILALRSKETLLLRANIVLAIFILAATALARAS